MAKQINLNGFSKIINFNNPKILKSFLKINQENKKLLARAIPDPTKFHKRFFTTHQ